MKIKALRNCGASGFDLKAGKIYEVNDDDGKYLVAIGKANLYEGKGKVEKAVHQEGAQEVEE